MYIVPLIQESDRDSVLFELTAEALNNKFQEIFQNGVKKVNIDFVEII